MTPKELDSRITALEKVQNNNMYALFVNRLIQNIDAVLDTDIDRDVVVGPDGGTFQVLDYPDKFLRIIHNGKIYLVPAYLIDR